VTCQIQLETVCEGYDRKTEWFQPRVGIIPPSTAVLTMTRAQLWGSDIFTAVQEIRSDDLGRTWSAPVAHATLDRRPLIEGFVACPCDLTPAWHAASGTLLMTGHTAAYATGEQGALVQNSACPREVVWSMYDAAKRTWSEWQTLAMPDRDGFYWTSAGCSQRVDLPNGEILLPISVMPREMVGTNFWKGCFSTRIARCSFDGKALRLLELGEALTVPRPRGLYEPSLARWNDLFYLTLRNDAMGYAATSRDGLHFETPIPWTFDDGQDLGSYNTQQHWVTHSDALFLTYTRRGANNDEVVRHRAPLFMAQVDPQRLCVLRHTERILVPNHGAQLGNFGAISVSPAESWVVTSEGMRGDAKDHANLAFAEQRGANNRVYVCRILWDLPNRHESVPLRAP
jgi:hypothetical protein